jgi:diguanylate cyclase (GGDEF)-like protein
MSATSANTLNAPWAGWALENLHMGLLVLDGQGCVVFVNRWFLQHAHLASDQLLQNKLADVFPQLDRSHFNLFFQQAQASGFPALLSQTLHPAPFPLYSQAPQRGQDKLLRQSIRIIPMGFSAAGTMDQRYTLIQITDVTQSVLRERLLKAQAIKFDELAHMDTLTGLGNRRQLDERLAAEMHTASRIGTHLAALMFDIDFFKQYNDHYGHLAGDTCLRQVADVLRELFRRPRDVVARFGGEEMVVILPETDGDRALQLAHNVLQRVRDLKIPHVGSCIADVVTLSAGIAVATPAVPLLPTALLNLADQALYHAKESGRNRVIACPLTGGPDRAAEVLIK